jgi:hypothetical protein
MTQYRTNDVFELKYFYSGQIFLQSYADGGGLRYFVYLFYSRKERSTVLSIPLEYFKN